MDYLKLYLFIFHCFLEVTVLSNLTNSLLTPTCILYLGLCMNGLYLANQLRKYRSITIFGLAAVDLTIECYFFHRVYVETLPQNNLNWFFMYFVSVFAFIGLSNPKGFKEYKQSKTLQNILFCVGNMITCHSTFNHFRIYHHSKAEKTNLLKLQVDYSTFFTDFFSDLMIFGNLVLIIQLIKYFSAKTKELRRGYLKGIFGRIFLRLAFICVFYAYYCSDVTNKLHTFVDQIPAPHNLIVSNLLPENKNTTFRLIINFMLYYFV